MKKFIMFLILYGMAHTYTQEHVIQPKASSKATLSLRNKVLIGSYLIVIAALIIYDGDFYALAQAIRALKADQEHNEQPSQKTDDLINNQETTINEELTVKSEICKYPISKE